MNEKLQSEDYNNNNNKENLSTGQLLGTFDHNKQFLNDKILKKARLTV